MTVPHIYEPTMINYGLSQLNFVLCLPAICGVVLWSQCVKLGDKLALKGVWDYLVSRAIKHKSYTGPED